MVCAIAPVLALGDPAVHWRCSSVCSEGSLNLAAPRIGSCAAALRLRRADRATCPAFGHTFCLRGTARHSPGCALGGRGARSRVVVTAQGEAQGQGLLKVPFWQGAGERDEKDEHGGSVDDHELPAIVFTKAEPSITPEELEVVGVGAGQGTRAALALQQAGIPFALLGGVASLTNPVGAFAEKLRMGLLRLQTIIKSAESVVNDPEMIDRFFQPFLGGTFFFRELATSSRMLEYATRMLALGDNSLPTQGIGALPQVPALQLDEGSATVPGKVVVSGDHRASAVQSWPSTWREGVLLKDFCTWGIGGAADFLVEVRNAAELQDTIRACQTLGLRHLLIGSGSNCLFDSLGFRGCVIINKMASKHVTDPGTYTLGSGYPFNQLGIECSRDGFAGLEFASGIPGTVGGAVFMNAGAGGQETCDFLHSVEVLHLCGSGHIDIREYNRADLAFGYRESPFQRGGLCSADIITAATFKLTPSKDSRARQVDYMDKRRKTQPLLCKSAGSVFRNPGGDMAAGALIDQAGLKGFAIGGAQVSEVHANFLINSRDCSSSEMLELIAYIKCQVKERFGVDLMEEVRYIAPCGD